MNDAEKFELAKQGLQFCPRCGKALEKHPLHINTLSCYTHGDFRLLWIEGDLQVRWEPMELRQNFEEMFAAAIKSIRQYTTPITQFTRVQESIRNRQQATADELIVQRNRIRSLREIAEHYIKQDITFLEAAQLIEEVESGKFPDEPNEQQRRYARNVLDELTMPPKG